MVQNKKRSNYTWLNIRTIVQHSTQTKQHRPPNEGHTSIHPYIHTSIHPYIHPTTTQPPPNHHPTKVTPNTYLLFPLVPCPNPKQRNTLNSAHPSFPLPGGAQTSTFWSLSYTLLKTCVCNGLSTPCQCGCDDVSRVPEHQ